MDVKMLLMMMYHGELTTSLFAITLQPHYNLIVYSKYLVITWFRLGFHCPYFLHYDTDSNKYCKPSAIMRFW